MEFKFRKPGIYLVGELKIDNIVIDLGMLTKQEASELSDKLREAAEKLREYAEED